MDVRFTTTTSSKLSQLTVTNGQLIYLSDQDAAYYDMGGQRKPLSSMRVVSSLPATSVAQEGILYAVIDSDGHADASLWSASRSEYVPLSGYVATATTVGLVKPDGTTITIDSNGTISCHPEVTSLPASSITYDNTSSGLTGDDAQEAIDEVLGVANDAAAAASTAISIANDASASASTAVQIATAASEAAAAATTALAALETRLQAVEAVAAIALTTEG